MSLGSIALGESPLGGPWFAVSSETASDYDAALAAQRNVLALVETGAGVRDDAAAPSFEANASVLSAALLSEDSAASRLVHLGGPIEFDLIAASDAAILLEFATSIRSAILAPVEAALSRRNDSLVLVEFSAETSASTITADIKGLIEFGASRRSDRAATDLPLEFSSRVTGTIKCLVEFDGVSTNIRLPTDFLANLSRFMNRR